LGADAVIDLKQSDEKISADIASHAGETGYDIVLDYLWGRPAELILKTFVPRELGFSKKRIRYIHIGEKAGASISLPGESLRTSGLEITGLGNIPPGAVPEALSQIWDWMKEDKLHIEIERVPLAQIETAWKIEDTGGKRMVIIP
jgi:NADPH:quinone reductase-like Zn-dependent oxidoreductase